MLDHAAFHPLELEWISKAKERYADVHDHIRQRTGYDDDAQRASEHACSRARFEIRSIIDWKGARHTPNSAG